MKNITKKTSTAFCVHGSSNENGLCVCDNGWEGVDCSQPICQNYGVRHAHTCNCKNFETEFDCSSKCDREIRYNLCLCIYNSTIFNASNNSDGYLLPTTMAPSTTLAPETRAFAFIIDVAGNESAVFNTIMVCNNW